MRTSIHDLAIHVGMSTMLEKRSVENRIFDDETAEHPEENLFYWQTKTMPSVSNPNDLFIVLSTVQGPTHQTSNEMTLKGKEG